MPIEFGLWRLDGPTVEPVPAAQLEQEERLEDVIQQRIDILGLGNLLVIGRQVITDHGKRIDLLAMNGQGELYIDDWRDHISVAQRVVDSGRAAHEPLWRAPLG